MKNIFSKFKAILPSMIVEFKSRLADPTEVIQLKKQIMTQLTLAVCLTVIAGVVFINWSNSLYLKYHEVEVVVASRDITSGTILTASDLTTLNLKESALPTTIYTQAQKQSLVGKSVIHAMSKNQVFTRNEFLSEVPAGIVGLGIEENRKGLALPVSWLSGNYPSMKKGDTLTFMVAALQADKSPDVSLLAQHVQVIDVIAGTEKEPATLLVKVDEKLASELIRIHALQGQAFIHALVDGYKPVAEKDATTAQAQ